MAAQDDQRCFPLLLVGAFATLAGCELPGYLAEQAWGQIKLLAGREPIAEVLQRSALSARERQALRLVLLARRYAFDEIGLRETGAYKLYYDSGAQPIAYNVSAAQKDALRPQTWTFPVVGALPYIGFFAAERARAFERRLRARDLDTHLRPVSAYSTLGWFDDPLYSSLLEGPIWRTIDTVFHETTHTTLFLRGRVGFNESLAVFVGEQGTLDFFAQRLGPDSALVRAARRDFARGRRFARLIEALRARLERLYAQPIDRRQKLERREAIFAWAKARFRELFPERPRASFLERPLNNAVVLSYGLYLRGLRFHRAIYECVDRRLARFVRLYRHAQYLDDPRGYLERRCELNPAW